MEEYNKILDNLKLEPDPLILYENNDLKLLKQNSILKLVNSKSGEWYSQINTKNKKIAGRYLSIIMYFIDKVFKNNITNILELGLGGGSIAYHIANHYKNYKLTAVDYSDDMIYIAKTFFYKNKENIIYIKDDAEKYIMNNKFKYDLIIDDLFINDNNKPPFCKSIEYIRNIRDSLTKKGIFISNQIIGPKHLENLNNIFSFVKTVQFTDIYTHRLVICMKNKDLKINSIINNTIKYHNKEFKK